jgi:antirestriction protein ArdC
MTYKQAEEQGCHVRKGEHGVKIEYYGEYDPSKTQKGADILDKKINDLMDKGASPEEIEKAMEGQKVLYVKTYTVFNAAQIEGIESLQGDTPKEGEAAKRFRSHERVENIMGNCGVPIQYGYSQALYYTDQDVIKMPNSEWFSTPEYFYSTVLHEIAHSTGHPSRMNRDGLGEPFASPKYAMEELRAEMASAFVFQEIGMPLSETDMEEHAQVHAAYTQHWLKSLQGDYKEFFKAVRDAAKIADYTLAYERAKDKTLETEHDGTRPVEPAPDPVQAAKAVIGHNAIVTSAQKGKVYTGKIVLANNSHAIQKIGTGRGIIHSLAKIDDPSVLREGTKEVSISYEGGSRGSVTTVPREEELEPAMSR